MKKIALIISILLVGFQSFCQDVEQKQRAASGWYYLVKSKCNLDETKNKEYEYSTQKYSIVGTVSKKKLVENYIAKFYDTSVGDNLILEGKVFYDSGRLMIQGVRYAYSDPGPIKTYGIFSVSNMDDKSLCLKTKSAGKLIINCESLEYIDGYYLNCPVVFRGQTAPFIFVDGKTGQRDYSFFSAPVNNWKEQDLDAIDMTQLLLNTEDRATIKWDDGRTFTGRVKPQLGEDNVSVSFNLLEGEKTGMPSGPRRITVTKTQSGFIYCQEDNPENNTILKEEIFVSSTPSKYWDAIEFYENCEKVKWTYRNGNIFEGSVENLITKDENGKITSFASKALTGLFTYPNGDWFEGNISSSSVGPFYIDGTTHFKDGTTINGNWLSDIKITKEQWSKVYNCQSPSEAITTAKKLMHSNTYKDYVGIHHGQYESIFDFVQYFNPYREDICNYHPDIISYNTKTGQYLCKTVKDETESTAVEVIVDKNNNHIKEVLHLNNDLLIDREYVNILTWYSNGNIESIKSYLGDTGKIFLVCNFFSDGVLRSAYQYRIGNDGEIKLWKSKEAHPTFGGYTSKLYDLNGKYERTISWEIGTEIVGGILSEARYASIAPQPLNMNNFKLIEE